ncbi:hypothetical protein EON79_09035 [bacterium]|nr:MAG: hypothetical protein EON79_09035 [bacterium]
MRRLFPVLFALAASAPAQTWQDVANTRPDIYVTVRESATGTDSVEISPVNDAYPQEKLRERALQIAENLGETPRGLAVQSVALRSVRGSDPLQVTFGVDGLASKKEGWIRLSDIVKPFVADGVKGIAVLFERFEPNTTTVLDYRSDAVQMMATPQPGNVGAEFRIRISTDDASRIDIPVRNEPKAEVSPTKTVPPTRPDFVTYGIVAVAALALGALVYSLLLRPRSQPR